MTPVVASVVLSVGSYRSEDQANETMKGLEAKGLPVFSRVEAGRDIRVVLVGPYVSREEALEANKTLEELRYRNARIIVEPPSRR